MIFHTRPWQEVAQEAQAYRDRSIAAIKPEIPALPDPLPKNVLDIPGKLLSDTEKRLTSMSVYELLISLGGNGENGRLSATHLVDAFLRRAALAQKLTNCITELLPERAQKRAKFLDDYFEKNGHTIGPLHGLPISVKEHIGIKGLRMHASYVALWDTIATDDAHIVQILEKAGAVVYARTTQPQTIMHLETDSNLYGVTVNPFNSDLTAGGSSGGEGALVSMRGSCLGVGSDVGGSIRSPAANCGIYGLRPSYFRIPTDGWSSIAANVDEIPTVIGPLSTSIDGLELFMKIIIDAKPWLTEPALLPLPWTPTKIDTEVRPLKIAIMWHDGIVRPHPPITRALQKIAASLQQNSRVVITDWKPYLHDEAWAIVSSLYYPDGGEEDIELLRKSGEPILPLTKWIIQDNSCVKKLSMGELQYWKEEREAYRTEYAKVWNETGADDGQPIDAILCPVGPSLAPKHNTSKYWNYTSQWNLLDYPAAVFPVLKAHADIDKKERKDKPMSKHDKENWEQYGPNTWDGVPVSLQLVCRRCEDEKTLAILRFLQEQTGFPFEQFP